MRTIQPRVPYGWLERGDGVRVEVRNPTVWWHIEGQNALIESLQAGLAAEGATIEAVKTAHVQLHEHWWTRLGQWLRVVPASPLGRHRPPERPIPVRPADPVEAPRPGVPDPTQDGEDPEGEPEIPEEPRRAPLVDVNGSPMTS